MTKVSSPSRTCGNVAKISSASSSANRQGVNIVYSVEVSLTDRLHAHDLNQRRREMQCRRLPKAWREALRRFPDFYKDQGTDEAVPSMHN